MPTKKTAMLDLDWLGRPLLALTGEPGETGVWPLWSNSKSRSWAASAETTHEAGRHFFKVYGVLTRRLIFSPDELRLQVKGSSSEEEVRGGKNKERRLSEEEIPERWGRSQSEEEHKLYKRYLSRCRMKKGPKNWDAQAS